MATDADLLDLVVPERASKFRLDVLDATLSYIGTLGAQADAPATVENNINRTIKRTLNGVKIPRNVSAAVNPYTDRVRPMMVLENGSEYPLGVFLYADRSRLIDTAGEDHEASLVDQSIILDQGIAQAYSVPAGTVITTAITTLLATTPLVSYVVDQTAQQVGSALTWPAGTSLLKIVNDLAALAGFYSLFFDNAGVARVVVVPDLTTTTPTLTYAKGGRVLRSSIVRSDDALDTPNRYVAVDSSGSGFSGVWDVPADAPWSAANRGYIVTSTVTVQGLASTSDAAAAAKAAGQQDTSYEHLKFSTPPDPRHDTFDVIEFDGARWREQAWAITLREGTAMKHDLRRVYSAS